MTGTMKRSLSPLFIALALTLPLVGALAQQWSTDHFPAALVSCWLDDDDDERDTHSGTLGGDLSLAATQTASFNVNFRRVITSAKCREGLTVNCLDAVWRPALPRSPPSGAEGSNVGWLAGTAKCPRPILLPTTPQAVSRACFLFDSSSIALLAQARVFARCPQLPKKSP